MNINLDPIKPAQELIFSRKMQLINYLKTNFQKTNKTIGILRKLQTPLPKAPLIAF